MPKICRAQNKFKYLYLNLFFISEALWTSGVQSLHPDQFEKVSSRYQGFGTGPFDILDALHNVFCSSHEWK